jgi:hypothetical protein
VAFQEQLCSGVFFLNAVDLFLSAPQFELDLSFLVSQMLDLFSQVLVLLYKLPNVLRRV